MAAKLDDPASAGAEAYDRDDESGKGDWQADGGPVRPRRKKYAGRISPAGVKDASLIPPNREA